MLMEEWTKEEYLEYIIEEAREEAREEGLKEGREEGEEIGMGKGIEKEKLIIAKNLLAKGSTPEFVHEITGLTPKEIKEIDLNDI